MHGFGTAGAIGVDLFFVISGFIMIATAWELFGTPGASARFLERRFLRIYPAYGVALAAFIIATGFIGSATERASHTALRRRG
jgi:peptidoglycan/LPS O-acetylase OafA/YrhL